MTETTTKISIRMPYIKQRTLLMTFGTPTCYLGCDCACRRLDSREVDRDDVVAREGPYTLKLLVCRKYNDEDKGKQQAIMALVSNVHVLVHILERVIIFDSVHETLVASIRFKVKVFRRTTVIQGLTRLYRDGRDTDGVEIIRQPKQ